MLNMSLSGRGRSSRLGKMLSCGPLLALAAALPSAAQAAPSYYAGTNNYYEFVQGTFSWTYALHLAGQMSFEGRQGHLVTITSAGEDAFVRSLYDGFAWGAASDAGDEGNFTWRAGPETGQALTYSAWNIGEPNNAWGDEHYLNITSHDGWNDVSNGYGLSFVVEYETAAVPEPLSWAMMVCGFGLIGGAIRRRDRTKAFA